LRLAAQLPAGLTSPLAAAQAVAASPATAARLPARAESERDSVALGNRWWFWTGVALLTGAAVVSAALLATNGARAAPSSYRGDFNPPALPVEVKP